MTRPDALRIVALGGMGEVGRNLTVVEFGGQILVIDCGFMFPESDMLGVDLVVPNIGYLVERAEHVLAYLVTHGHEDHIGALPYVLPQVPAPVYATRLTRGLIEVKLKEHGLLAAARLETLVPGQPVQLGPFRAEPFRVSHSIPDAVGFGIETPLGTIVHTGEFKFDLTPVDGQVTDIHRLAEFGRAGVLLLMSDSTNAERSGHTPSEAVVREALQRVFDRAAGRIVVATFASNISRIQEVLDIAAARGRRVGFVGRSMEQNTAMAMALGYLHAGDGVIASPRELDDLPDWQVVICCTGTQGEPTSALVRMANDSHRSFKLRKGDTVVLSATPIPGNEELVHRTLNQLFRKGADVVYHALTPVHVSGHASREEQKLMLRLVAPRYFVPMGGEYRMLVQHARLATEIGMPPEAVLVIENGDVLEIDGESARIVEQVPGGYVYVDGLGVGDIGQVVLRDRHHLARDGFVVVVVTVVSATGAMASPPEILTRGFVYLPSASDLIEDLLARVGALVDEAHGAPDILSNRLRDALGEAIYNATKRRPMIMPLIVEV